MGVMEFAKIARDLWIALRGHYAFALAAVVAGILVAAVALLAGRIGHVEFAAIAGLFALLGPLMIVASEVRAEEFPESDWQG
jgi:hypothetical protein